MCNTEPGPIGHHQPTGLCVTPQRIVAPVGAEVVLKAAVCDQKGMTTANEKIEWMLAPGGVGQFIALGDRPWYDTLLGATTPEKITSTYVVNSTSSKYVCLNRGTPDRGDDVPVIKGQAWVTVTSPLEGASKVTALAPNVYGWDQRQQTATVYWVDANWNFPPPAINPAGTRHTFTTCVCRQTSGCAVPGWRVRYELLDGPDASLAPSGARTVGYGSETANYQSQGARIIEVPTDANGQASVDIFQTTPSPGTSHLSVQVIRPGELSHDNTRLVVATGATEHTWGSSELYVRKTGPSQASVGSTMLYTVEVRNASSQTARGVILTEALPPGTALVSSSPPATPSGSTLTWNFGDLSAGESRRVDIGLRADRFGTINNCATVRTADGATAQDCVATTVGGPSIDVVVTVTPEQAMVGQQATFVAKVTNRSGDYARGLVIVERYDSGLRHQAAANPIEADLGDLAPGQSRDITSTFTITAPGQQCTNVEVTGQAGIRASGQACVTAVPSAGGVAPPVVAPPVTPSQPAAGPKPTLTARKTGPTSKNVGDTATFEIEITNTSNVPATMLKVADNYDLTLDPTSATDGHAFVGDDLVWMVDTLPPGKTMRFQVVCRCVARSDNSCNRVTVTCQEGARADAQTCLSIQGSNTPLQVSISDQTDPVQLGNDTTYQINVSNPGATADSNVQLAVTLGPQMSPLATGIAGPSNYRIDGNVVTFAPVASLAAGTTLTYRVPARAVQAGTAQISANVTSANSPSPISSQETTTIFAQ